MAALQYLIDTLLSLAELAFLLRLLFQWARADFRNPLLRSLVELTNPVLVPLRRVLPSVGRVDTATVVVVLLLGFLRSVAHARLDGSWLFISWAFLVERTVLELVRMVLWTFFVSVFGYALISTLSQGSYSPPLGALGALAEPILRPIRKLIPPLANLDLSPLWACILIQALLLLLP